MALPAAKLESENHVEARVTRLEEKVDRLQSDMTEVKADIRRVDSKADAIKDALSALDPRTQASISSLELRTQESFAELSGKLASLDKKIAVSFQKIGRSRLADRIWWLLIAGTLLGVMARGFKWLN
jgi:chromosome segregation ATPase